MAPICISSGVVLSRSKWSSPLTVSPSFSNAQKELDRGCAVEEDRLPELGSGHCLPGLCFERLRGTRMRRRLLASMLAELENVLNNEREGKDLDSGHGCILNYQEQL
ncbi:uncharacterized protein ARMOST_02491 [Armillaria ostoyae]|uniref:Uncharacterized protein n=1 Tax=Armillaria ostoyae TaxID=47428 RepID=A0A284QRU6_ARMOS|nr:uncharacterized protein ARMOST_02491 [Armillaria ostoyae]